MSALAAEHHAINLSQGFPDFPVSEKLVELTRKAMKEGHNQYAPMQGVPALRKMIADKHGKANGIRIDPETEVTVTAGATEALYAAIAAVVHDDDEVVILEPCFDSYEPAILLNGGVPVPVHLAQPDFHIDWQKVRDNISERTRLLIINSPHNPTGAVLSPSDITELEKLVTDFNILILSDEVYEHLIFDGLEHQSVLKSQVLRDKSIAVYSFGKTFHVTGWKIGYSIAPEEISREIRKVHQFLTFSVNTPIQYALAEFLEDPGNYEYLPDFFQCKRDLFLEVIRESGFEPVKSSGTYFQLMSYKEMTGEHDYDLAVRLTREHGIASIPISVFYKDRTDHKLLRFCFAKEDETLKKAGELICRI
jgi:methionine aminotransferase